MKVTAAQADGAKVRLDVEANEGEYLLALANGFESFLGAMGVEVTPETDMDEALRSVTSDGSDEQLNHVRLDCAVSYLMPRAVNQAGVFPACNPSIVGAQHEEDGSISFGIEVFPKPQVELSNYGPARIKVPPLEPVTEEEIDQRVQAMAAQGATMQNDIITGKAKMVPATVDDEWVRKNVDGCGSVAQLREQLRAAGEQYKAGEWERIKQDAAMAQLAERMVGEIPADTVEAVAADMVDELESQLAAQDVTMQDFLAQQRATLSQIRDDARLQALANLAHGAVLDAYFAHEGLELKDGDIEAALSVIAPGAEDQAREALERSGFMFTVLETARRLRATCSIMDAAEIQIIES